MRREGARDAAKQYSKHKGETVSRALSGLPASLGQALGCPEVPLPEDQEEAGTPALFPAATSTRHRLAHCPHPTDACGDWREHLVPKRRTRCPWSPWHQGEEPGFTPRSV